MRFYNEDSGKQRGHDKKAKGSQYLSNPTRFISSIVLSVVEFFIMVVALLLISGHIANLEEDTTGVAKSLADQMAPGGLAFNSLAAFLPIIIISSVGSYFGEGSIGRLVCGVGRCVAGAVWFIVMLSSLGNSIVVDSSVVTDVSFDLSGAGKLLAFITIVTVIIPIGEFLGARRKHLEAVASKEDVDAFADMYC